MSKPVVIKIGGHLISAEEVLKENVRRFCKEILDIASAGYQPVVVVGGGALSRRYVGVARELGRSEALCDLVGIEASRLNARLFIACLGKYAYPSVPRSYEELVQAHGSGKVVVSGGMQPGQSTNAVAAVAAELIGAELLVNATNVEGVYTADPKEDPTAVKLDIMTIRELLELVEKGSFYAGSYELFDLVAARIVERSRLTVAFVDGRVPGSIKSAVIDRICGTLVVPEEG